MDGRTDRLALCLHSLDTMDMVRRTNGHHLKVLTLESPFYCFVQTSSSKARFWIGTSNMPKFHSSITMSSSVAAAAARAAKGATIVSLSTIGSQWTDCETKQTNLRTKVSKN
jgi:hypothetical protein